jgi:ribosomal protein L37E
MNKVFCVSCGFKNSYEVAKPKFCANCGTPISGGVRPKELAQEEVKDEPEVSSLASLDLRKLRRDIVAEANTQKTTLTDLWKSASESDAVQEEYKRNAPNLPEGDALLKQTQADCASSRPTEIDG